MVDVAAVSVTVVDAVVLAVEAEVSLVLSCTSSRSHSDMFPTGGFGGGDRGGRGGGFGARGGRGAPRGGGRGRGGDRGGRGGARGGRGGAAGAKGGAKAIVVRLE